MHYRLKGREVVPCTMMEWAVWLEENRDARTIAYWEFKSCNVSTVFLGLDHGWGGRLAVFETMVFGGALNDTQERYATYDEAEKGHMKWCQEVSRIEAMTHWRKMKRQRNKLEKQRRQLNNVPRRRREMEKMKEFLKRMEKRRV